MTVTLSQLHVFPLKSARGVEVERWPVGARGFAHDRQFMVVDARGQFVTQREQPRLALCGAALEDDVDGRRQLVLTAAGFPPLRLETDAQLAGRVAVKVWRETVMAEPLGEAAARWMSRFLEVDAQLVRFPDEAVRQVDPTYARAGDQVGFADGFSFLLASESSLNDLNARLVARQQAPVGMHRFRPNLVVRGCEPFAEDGWRRIRIGELEFEVAKPCARCPIVTVDEMRGVHQREPLRTLATFRRSGGKVMFGQNLIHRGEGMLEVGMPIEVLE